MLANHCTSHTRTNKLLATRYSSWRHSCVQTHIEQGHLVCRILVVCWVGGVVVQLSAHHDSLVEQAHVVEVRSTCVARASAGGGAWRARSVSAQCAGREGTKSQHTREVHKLVLYTAMHQYHSSLHAHAVPIAGCSKPFPPAVLLLLLLFHMHRHVSHQHNIAVLPCIIETRKMASPGDWLAVDCCCCCGCSC